LAALLKWHQGFMTDMDDPLHRRMRNLTRAPFAKRAVVPLADEIRAVSDDLLAAVAGRDEIELITDYGFQLPLRVVCALIGIPAEDVPFVRRVTIPLGRFVGTDHGHVDEAYPALRELRAYVMATLDALRPDPPTALLAALLGPDEDGVHLSDDELFSLATMFLFAGHETTTGLISNGFLALMRNRDQWRLLCDDPSRAPGAVEELLRYDPPAPVTRRVAADDCDLAGTSVPAGMTLKLLLGSANRDEAVWARPDELDVTRTGVRHLAFGIGMHHCLGAQLARLEAAIALETFARRFPDLSLATGLERLRWRDTPFLRGLEELPLALGRDCG
jgi:cytochrome P450